MLTLPIPSLPATRIYADPSSSDSVEFYNNKHTPSYYASQMQMFQSNGVFQDDFSLTNKSVTIDELLKIVEQSSSTHLSVAPDLKYQRVHLKVTHRRTSQFLVQLAELFNAEWSHTNNGYTLTYAPNMITYQRNWWRLYDGERGKGLVTGYGLLINGMSEKPKFKHPGIPLTEEDRFSLENGAYTTQFWYDLPTDMKSSIAHAMSYSFIYPRLPVFSSFSYEGGVVAHFSSLPDTCQKSFLNMATQLDPNLQPTSLAKIVILNEGFGFIAIAIKQDGNLAVGGPELHVRTYLNIPAFTVDHRDIPAVAERERNIPKAWVTLIEYQNQTFWNKSLSKTKVAERVTPRLSDVVDLMAKKTGSDFITDDYSLPQRPLDTGEKGYKWSNPINEELDKIAAQYDVSWRTDDKVILIRNNRWYRDDRLEVTDPLITRLSKIAEYTKGNFSVPLSPENLQVYGIMQQSSFAAENFSLWQLANGLYFYTDENRVPALQEQNEKTLKDSNCQPFSDIAQIAFVYNKTCLFYAGLTSQQRLLLLSVGVPFASLTNLQRQLLSSAAPQIDSESNDRSAVQMAVNKVPFVMKQNFIFGNSNYGSNPYSLRLQRVQLTKK